MHWTVEFVPEGAYVRVTTHGPFEPDHHLLMLDDLVSQTFWLPGAHTLFDHRDLDLTGTHLADMREAARNRRSHDSRLGDGRTAYLVSQLRDYGALRQLEQLAADTQSDLRVFMYEDEALRWLVGGVGQADSQGKAGGAGRPPPEAAAG